MTDFYVLRAFLVLFAASKSTERKTTKRINDKGNKVKNNGNNLSLPPQAVHAPR